jgi:cysteine synthase A
MLGLPFIAVVPRSTSPEKIATIEFYGGKVAFVEDGTKIYEESMRLAQEVNGHFMDQFTYAERVTDWRGNNNIAESIFEQMSTEEHPIPTWIVCSAGTGGTSATLGRYIRYRRFDTRLCVCDPEHSVFYDYYRTRDPKLVSCRPSNIEGIGRPQVVASFVPGVIDRMVRVSDAASIAATRFLYKTFGRRYGGSTGTNLYGALQIASQMKDGSIVSLLCDSGDRYLHTYYDDGWVEKMGFDIQPYLHQLDRFFQTGEWFEVHA